MMDKTYISGIKRHLRLDYKTKSRIVEGIQTEIQLALDNGETFEAIIARMGSPKELAEEYNQSYRDTPEYRRQRQIYIIKRIALISIIVAVASFVVSQIGTILYRNSDNVSAVGGVSGPESIVTIKHLMFPLYYLNLIGKIFPVALVILALSVTGWMIVTRKQKRK